MSYDNQSYNGGKILQSDDTVIDTEQFLESGEIVVTAIATPSAVTTTTDGVVRTYNNFSPTALKIINQDNEIFDLIELLQSGQIKVQLQGGAGELTQGYVVYDVASNGLVSREIAGSQNIVVENGDGSIGNALIKLADDVTLTGTLDTNGNAITSPVGQNLVLATDVADSIDLDSEVILVGSVIKHKAEISDNKIEFTALSQKYLVGGDEQVSITNSGFRLGTSGARVNTIDNTGTATSETALMTANAVGVFVGNAIISGESYRGGWDASTNLFPETGGSGAGGAVDGGDHWVITVAGTLGGTPVVVGASIFAIVDNPLQVSSNWIIDQSYVTSVFGRIGAVEAAIGDYDFPKISGICVGTQGGTGHTSTVVSDLLIGAAANSWARLATANSAILKTNQLGAPSWTAPMTNGQILIGSTGASPVTATLSGTGAATIINGAGSSTVHVPLRQYGTIYLNSGNTTGVDISLTTTFTEIRNLATAWLLQTPNNNFAFPIVALLADGRLEYGGTSGAKAHITAVLQIDDTTPSNYHLAIAKNGVNITQSISYSKQGASLTAKTVVEGINNGDYFSLFLRRQSGSSTVAIEQATLEIIDFK